ncbi:hypothetical protein AeMF1_020511 [Aphanomyces euteiches]|nr:hypothetical protein AeMF1_020511 [Aphanomyces euteiches]
MWQQNIKPDVISSTTGVPMRTLSRYALSWKSGQDARTQMGPQRSLPIALENDLVSWVISMQASGFPVTRYYIILKACVMCRVLSIPYVTDGWYNRFIACHPILTTRTAQVISRVRNATDINDIGNLFNVMLYPVITYKMDATLQACCGCQGLKQRLSNTLSAAFHMTYVACVSAAGFVVPPGQRVNMQVAEALGPTYVVASESGFINRTIFQLWLAMFASSVPASVERPLLLTLDGYDGRFSNEIYEEAKKLGIIILCLPANATHLLQPLDVAVFGPLKRRMKKYIFSYMVEVYSCCLSKDVAISLARKSWDVAVTSSNCVSGFKTCDLFPLSLPSMKQRYEKFKHGGVKAQTKYDTSWVQHQPRIRQEILVIPPVPDKRTSRRKNTVNVSNKIATGTDIMSELSKPPKRRRTV